MKMRRLTGFSIKMGEWRWTGFRTPKSRRASGDRVRIVREFYRLAEFLNASSEDTGANGRARRYWILSQMSRLKGDEDRLRNGTDPRD